MKEFIKFLFSVSSVFKYDYWAACTGPSELWGPHSGVREKSTSSTMNIKYREVMVPQQCNALSSEKYNPRQT